VELLVNFDFGPFSAAYAMHDGGLQGVSSLPLKRLVEITDRI